MFPLNFLPLLFQLSFLWKCVICGTSYLCSLICLSCGDVICGTSYPYSLICLSCGDVICGTSYPCSLRCLSCGDVICGTSIVYLVFCTNVGIVRTSIGTANGSIMPLISFCVHAFVLSSSLFTLEFEAIL